MQLLYWILKIFSFFDKDFVIPIEVIYPNRDHLSQFGDILSLFYAQLCAQTTIFRKKNILK